MPNKVSDLVAPTIIADSFLNPTHNHIPALLLPDMPPTTRSTTSALNLGTKSDIDLHSTSDGVAKRKNKASPKPKPPVNVDVQCAVITAAPNGRTASCARPLTCKRHSFAAKRAVPGRAAPFDLLLARAEEDGGA